MNITIGDNVRILSSTATESLGIAGLDGQIYGETTPSVTGVDVIGELTDDFALSVSVEGLAEYWISPELLEFLDHGEGTEIVIGNIRAVRRADGSWSESEIIPSKKWWQFWK